MSWYYYGKGLTYGLFMGIIGESLGYGKYILIPALVAFMYFVLIKTEET